LCENIKFYNHDFESYDQSTNSVFFLNSFLVPFTGFPKFFFFVFLGRIFLELEILKSKKNNALRILVSLPKNLSEIDNRTNFLLVTHDSDRKKNTHYAKSIASSFNSKSKNPNTVIGYDYK